MNNNTSLIPASMSDMMMVAKALAESGFFADAKEATQAFTKILAGAELGIPAFASMSGIHIVKGKPQLGGVLLGGLVKRSGKYDYRVVQQGPTACSIDFYQGAEKIGNCTFTIEQAKKAGTQNLDKFPENMLFARAMSNGVKWYCPDVTNGPVYVEGELADVQETTAEVVHEARPAQQPRQTPRPSKLETAEQMKQVQAVGPEQFIFDRIDEYAGNIDKCEDDASYDWNEQIISEDHSLPEQEKIALIKRSIMARTATVTDAVMAEVVKKRIAGWAKLITTDNVTALLGDLVEQAKANGVSYENKTFIAPSPAEAEVAQ